MEKVSLLIQDVQVFNSYLKTFRRADVSILDGKFYYIDTKQETMLEAVRTIDGSGYFLIPGLVDIHMHIESSMMTPEYFGSCLASQGVTTIVSEPHEMANVRGVEGICEMIQAASEAPIDIFYGIPSSVPSTNASLETTGGVVDLEAMKHLLLEKDVICVGEIMNYRQVIQDDTLEIRRFLDYLRKERPGYIVEGHCPSLVDLELAKYLFLGIDGDHTEHSLEEVRQRIENGMFFEIQEKMLKKEVIGYIRDNHLYEYCGFVTDDTMADVLLNEGHLNRVVEKAVERGFPLEQAIYCATYTNARRMHLFDRGVIAPGKRADFFLVKDPGKLRPDFVYKDGIEIFNRGGTGKVPAPYQFPENFYHSVQVNVPKPEEFRIRASCRDGRVKVRAIEVLRTGTQTREKQVDMRVEQGFLCWEESDCLLALVLERYGKNGNRGWGFVTGDCLKRGCVATTYFHDHHNLFVTGKDPTDMRLAIKRLLELQGGILTVENGEVCAELALPVGGILSGKTVEETGKALKKVRESLERFGYIHPNPIMSLCTLGLPVSPALKITDKGLVDVNQGKIVPIEMDIQGFSH